MITKSTYF